MAHHRVGNKGSPPPPPPTPRQDLISALPQHIIHHIFTFLYGHVLDCTYLLTRISVVSKQFLILSRTYPHVRFYSSDVIVEKSWWSSCLDSFSRIVMPFKHESVPLQSLILRVLKFDLERDDRIDFLLQHALANCVGDVEIYIDFPTLRYSREYPTVLLRLPESAPPCVLCRTLSLGMFEVDLQALLSVSPHLEHLVLSSCRLLGKDVTVSSPTLKALRLYICMSSEIDDGGGNFLVLQAPNLETLYVQELSKLVRIDVGPCKRLLKLELTGWNRNERLESKFNWHLYEDQIPKLPSLECLDLSYLGASKHVIISSLSLKELSLNNLSISPHAAIGAIRVDAPKLESLYLNEIHGCRTLHIAPSQNLRKISLKNVCIDASWFEEQLSDFPLLEDLVIRCDNKHMKRVNISHEGLSKLTIYMKEEEDVKISINTPRLLHFTLTDVKPLHLPAITDLKCPPSLNINLRIKWGEKRHLEKSWKLWQLLEAFSGYKCINLQALSGGKCISLPFNDIHEDLFFRLPLPFSEIKLLRPNDDDILEKLILLCCHPKMLTFAFPHSQIKFHYEEGTLQEDDTKKGHFVACWRRYLRGVTLVNFEGDQSRLRNFFIENAEISNECIRQVSQ